MDVEHWEEVTIEYVGKTVKGRYNVSGGSVTVVAWNSSKTAQLGILPAERVAKMLLRALASEGD